MASPPPPFWPRCWQMGQPWLITFAGHQQHFFPHKGRELAAYLARCRPSALPTPGSTQRMGDVTHGLVGLRLVSGVTAGDTLGAGAVVVLTLQLRTKAQRDPKL